jgi:vancomycin permeability regulator SanA
MFVTVDGLSDDLVESDVAIILGNKVNENGEPSDRLKARLDVAVKLFNDSVIKYIVVSGGIGKEGYDEAQVMKTYLVDNQVLEKIVIVDNNGNNTYLTASNFVEINKKYQFKSIVLVSQFYHLSRTKLIFKKFLKSARY